MNNHASICSVFSQKNIFFSNLLRDISPKAHHLNNFGPAGLSNLFGRRDNFDRSMIEKLRGGTSETEEKLSSGASLITDGFARKKWLKYGEYAGSFENFNRLEEIDQDDSVDTEIKNLKSGGAFGTNRGDGFGHLGKGSKNPDSPIVKFHKEYG